MADISQIEMPNGSEYNLKDTIARKHLSYFGTCATAAATAAKVVTVDEDSFELQPGVIVGILFTNSNTADDVTLNVNSSGAKSIYYNNAVYDGHSTGVTGYAKRTTFYMYDGTYWVFLSQAVVDSNTDTKVRQTLVSGDANRPLLMAYSANTVTTTNVDNVSYRNNSIYANPSTGTVTATNFDGKINNHTVNADVPSGAVFTDTKVDQQLYSDNYDLPLLMSYVSINNQDTTINNKAFRNNSIYANPNTGNIQAIKLNGTTIGNSPSFSDDKVNQVLDSANSNRPIALCYGSTSNTDTNSVHQLYRNNDIYANPNTGYVYAKSFYDSYYSVWTSEAVKLTENTDNNQFPIVFGANATTDTKVAGLYKNYGSYFRFNPAHHNMFSHNICGLTFSGGITTTGNDCKVVSMALKFRSGAGYSGLIFSRGGLAAFFLKMPSTYSTSGATFSSNILVGNMTIQCSGGTDEAMGNSYFVSVTSNTSNDYIRFIWTSNSQGSTRYNETYYRAYANGSSTNTIDTSKRWT